MIATRPRIIPLLGDASAEVHAATSQWPVCLRLSDGENHCAVDLDVATWAALRARIDEAMGVEVVNA